MYNFDVIIVGACTAGTYFSSLLAQKGLNVLVIDKCDEKNLCSRLDIFHFTRDSYKEFDLDESVEGDEEFVHNFDLCISKSALDNYPKKSFLKVSVMHLPLFIKRLRKKATKEGVTFRFNCEFKDLSYDEDGKINGIILQDGEIINSRLVVDASGIPSVVRRKVISPYMENFEIGPKEKFYVLLKYVELLDKTQKIDISTSWPYFKGWIAPQHNTSGAIIGVGANISYEYAYKCMKTFEDHIDLPTYTLQYEEKGCTPYRRPPYSFVSDGFLVIGDAACLTKPWNGEGITAAWRQCTPASEIVGEALKDGSYPTIDKLWKINTLYQRGEGKEFASTRALLVRAVQMSKEDNDFLFANNIVFVSDDEGPNKKVIRTLLKGLLKRKFSFKALCSLLKGTSIANRIEKHYAKYPTSPLKYGKWIKKAQKLWKKAGTMADAIKDA